MAGRVLVVGLLCFLLALGVVSEARAALCIPPLFEPCLPAARDMKAQPSKECCSNVASFGKGTAGAKCLCSLVTDGFSKDVLGVNKKAALTIPHKCGLKVPHFKCGGIYVPGG